MAAVVYDRVPTDLTGIVIGGSLTLGISFAAIFSNGILNPAVALGVHSFSWMYLLVPIAGSILGMQAFKAVNS